MPLPWPAALRPKTSSWSIENASRTGGASITGAEQVVSSDAGRWRCSMTFPAVREEWIFSLRALVAALDGRAGEVEVPVFDAYTPSDANGRRVSPVGAATFDWVGGESFISDLSGLGQTPQTYATLAANASIGATRLTANAASNWMIPRPGQYFGIGSRLYIATMVYQANAGSTWTVDFRPRLRVAASAGARIITDYPVATMRLDDVPQIELEFSRFGEAQLQMVEAL